MTIAVYWDIKQQQNIQTNLVSNAYPDQTAHSVFTVNHSIWRYHTMVNPTSLDLRVFVNSKVAECSKI